MTLLVIWVLVKVKISGHFHTSLIPAFLGVWPPVLNLQEILTHIEV